MRVLFCIFVFTVCVCVFAVPNIIKQIGRSIQTKNPCLQIQLLQLTSFPFLSVCASIIFTFLMLQQTFAHNGKCGSCSCCCCGGGSSWRPRWWSHRRCCCWNSTSTTKPKTTSAAARTRQQDSPFKRHLSIRTKLVIYGSNQLTE